MTDHHDSDCMCALCHARQQGLSQEEVQAKYQEWEREKMEQFGWIVHFVAGDTDEIPPLGVDFHTHGLEENFSHPDLQIVLPIPSQVAHNVFSNVVDRIKEGEKFSHLQRASKIIKNLDVMFVRAKEGDRRVLRVVLPDPGGNVDPENIEAPYLFQYPVED